MYADAAAWHRHFVSVYKGDPMGCNKFRFLRALGTGIAFLMISTAALAQTFIGPLPYLSKNDSPFLASINAGTTFLETFETGAFTAPGVTASAGFVIGPGGLTDSVDGDDGSIDGSGTNGHSFFSGSGAAGITFTFDATALHTYEGGQQVHYGGIRGLAFSPDAKQIVAGGLHKATNPLGNVQEPLALRFDWESAAMVGRL